MTPPPAIAIVGIGCRFPGGAHDVESFWTLLARGRSGIGEVPAERWNVDRYFAPDPAAWGAMVTRWGAFLDRPDAFDARFWGVSPREAMRMDPQQRWLLEVAWEAIEDGGIAPVRLRGRRVGVFIGIAGNDYGGLQLPNLDAIDAHTNSGSTLSIAANRVSYMLDLRGPSVSVDTACSSSLVAVSLACDSIWAGRCEAALAGGVNAILTPHATIGFSKASMLSPTGQCFAFDARANGYVRAEGAAIVLMKPLGSALADGDRVYAVIRAAVVNQDGRTSSMLVPGVETQVAMLREAYERAQIDPADVGYVEAHGTGTPVGDPIEAAALGRVLGAGRHGRPNCLIGSVKTNIGHLEAASGMPGLIKAALVAQRSLVPASLNFEQPNPHIPFDTLGLQVASSSQPLPSLDRTLPVVGVNSFGFGGTNAHVVLEAPPASAPRDRLERCDRPCLLPVSARDAGALREYVERFQERLAESPGDDFFDLCAAAGARKEHHNHRLVLIGRNESEMRRRAGAWLHAGRAAGVVTGRGAARSRLVFVFTGQGSQWWAMGRRLLEREPLFRQTVAAIDARIRAVAGWSLIDEMLRDEAASNIERTDVAQPAIFALQVGLAELWKSWGIVPTKTIGHSVGEVAGAYCAGIYSLDDATDVILHRSRLQHRAAGGRMLVVALTPDAAARAIAADRDCVELAAINSPRLVTLAGDFEPLSRIANQTELSGVFTRWLPVRYAFHTAHMDRIRGDLLEALADVRPRPSTLPFVSTVTGDVTPGERLDAEYWWRNVRDTVLFAPAMAKVIRDGDDAFLELGAHPSLESSMQECLAAEGKPGSVWHSLRRDRDDSEEMVATLASLHVAGFDVNWRAVNQSEGPPVRLPHYPWARESFWLESVESQQARVGPVAHPLLGARIAAAVPMWQSTLDLHRLGYLDDHRVWDRVVFPAAGFAEMGLAISRALFPQEPHAIEDLDIARALFIDHSMPPAVQTVFMPADKTFSIYSSSDGHRSWELHARGRLTRSGPDQPAPVDLDAIRGALAEHFDHDRVRDEFASRGYQFGPSFRQVQDLWRVRGEALERIEAPPPVAETAERYCFHPAILDACFHVFIGTRIAAPQSRPEDDLFLPASFRRIRVYCDRPPARLWSHAILTADDGRALVADVHVYDDEGRRIADVFGFRLDHVGRTHAADESDCLYRFKWEPQTIRGAARRPGRAPISRSDRDRIVGAGEDAVGAIRERHQLTAYEHDFLPRLAATARVLVEHALVQLGWRPRVHDCFTFEDLARALGIVSAHHRAARNMLRELERGGLLRGTPDGGWEVLREPRAISPDAVLDGLAAEVPSAAAEVGLLRRTGPHLAAILAGDVDALDLVFPAGAQAFVERFYAEGAAYPAYFELISRLVAEAVAAFPGDRPVRVLEVGAGTGALTRAVLPVLPAGRTEYLFTDIGSAFIAAARTRFADTASIDCQVFDLDRDPADQGIPASQFDIVLASDVLHATADLRQTLRHLRRCLAPGGLLLALDIVTRAFIRDTVVFGLLDGWWRFTDTDVRSDSPLLDRSQWEQLLGECGFDHVRSIGCAPGGGESEHAALVGFATAVTPAASRPTVAVPDADTSSYVVFADEHGIGTSLAARLRRTGHRVLCVRPGPRFEQIDEHEVRVAPPSDAELRQLLEGHDARFGPVAGVIHCWSLDHAPAASLTGEQLRAAQSTGVMSAYAVVRAVASLPTRVWFVTRAAQFVAAGDRGDGLTSVPLVGLIRVANNEHGCRFSLIDLDRCSRNDAVRHLMDEITNPHTAEFEVAYRGGLRHALRLERVRADQLPSRSVDAARTGTAVRPYRLHTANPGILTNLALYETSRHRPQPHEIEVCVRAGGINFRDVMKALGTYPGNPVDLRWFGDDFAGVVERVGNQALGFQPGDAVLGLAPQAFAAFATTDARMAVRIPRGLSFLQAATIPTAFLTAHYALTHLARLRPGERILIHAGAGGVGQAAIQIAKHLGLEIFATAGTPEKRAFLASMGVAHVMSSRTLDFADEIAAITRGEGVDAVLNSLADDFIPKSLSVLAPFGRFLEIGKVDVYRNTQIGLRPLADNISYHVIDLTQHVRRKPALVAHLLRELVDRFEAGDYQPLPHTAFPITEAAEAFRFMAQARHVGKNVLSFDVDPIPIRFCADPAHRFRADATYLITGGAGGFGFELARWIAAHGGRHLVLLSRSGPRDEATRQAIGRLREDGLTVIDARGDVSRQSDVERVVEQIRRDMPPLKGVFHGAMVLDDELVTALTDDRIWAVLEPKMTGAWQLHLATRECPLDHFVCFSSFSAVVGAPKQSSYNAGNSFLDALAHYRHACGLPALTVSWGAILGAGFVERNRKTAAFLDRMGFGAFQIDRALKLLDELLTLDAIHVAAAPATWSAIARLSPLVAASKTYAEVARAAAAEKLDGPITARLAGARPEDQARLLEDFIAGEVAGVFGTMDAQVDRTAPLPTLGLDSLLAIELTSRLEARHGLQVPMGTLLGGPSVRELAQRIAQSVAAGAAGLDTTASVGEAADDAGTPSPAAAERPQGAGAGTPHIVPLLDGKGQAPLFAFHAVGGGIGIYTGLVAQLGEHTPVYGVESRLMQGEDREYPDLEAMTSAYAAAVRRAHAGPYRLFGFSLGGYLAARVAEALERDGETVELVGIVEWDAERKANPEAHRQALARLALATYLSMERETGMVRALPEARLRADISRLVDRIVFDAGRGGDLFFRWAVENDLIASASLEQTARRYLDRVEQHCAMLAHDLPRPRFRAALAVWRAREGFGSGVESWDHLGSRRAEFVFDGDHSAWIRPPALDAIALQIRQLLAEGSRVAVAIERG